MKSNLTFFHDKIKGKQNSPSHMNYALRSDLTPCIREHLVHRRQTSSDSGIPPLLTTGTPPLLLAAEHANRLHHLRYHAACALALKMRGADSAPSRETRIAGTSGFLRDQRPPTSPAMTTRRALPFDSHSSGYLSSLRLRAC